MALEKELFEARTYPMHTRANLTDAARAITLRCDAKQADPRFLAFDDFLKNAGYFELGKYLPKPFVKGIQPVYLDTAEGVPVINTLSIQKLQIHTANCRHMSEEDFEEVPDEKRLKKADVLLTLDGGTSIGKPVLFDLDDDYTVDSHIAILRPERMSALSLVYLLASPYGQLQFERAESGASGQTTVTEEDIRRFRFPSIPIVKLEKLVQGVHAERRRITSARLKLDAAERALWDRLFGTLAQT